ncbi:MAG: cell division control protein 6 [Syntrophorhabdus sp. PtaU1.Bin050]|nr:MAG: cell division control protein 6 [Syntrophorhabdus sp. PtaU1.Bin050]
MKIPYLEYFGLAERPFGLTPDPHFYFETETHREAMAHLRFLLGQKEGFALIHGDVGLGKTTLSRIFLSSLDKETYNTALILNPIMDEREFLISILKELGLEVRGVTKKELFDELQKFLLEEYRQGRETVLAIDEAQLLSNELFELIRILSNIETEKEKMLRIILLGQPELVQKLKDPQVRYLAQRITVTYKLRPFSEREVGLYINYRLVKAGSKGGPTFKKNAVRRIFRASRGCPRLVNILSDRCMLALYGRSKESVDKQIVADVLEEEDIPFTSVDRGPSLTPTHRVVVLSLIGLILILFAAFFANLIGYW